MTAKRIFAAVIAAVGATGVLAAGSHPDAASVPSAAVVPAVAEGQKYAVIVQGASGEPQYARMHRGWVDGLAGVLRSRMKIDPARISILAEQPGANELPGNAESVRKVLGGLAASTKPDDLVFIMLIGHGSGQDANAKFNLIGPDLTAVEWAGLLKPIPARLVVVDSTSSSFPFLAGLAGPNRVIVTATSNFAQRYHTIFPEAFIQALAASDSDADANGRVSVMEAFNYAARLVALHYEQNNRMATEVPMLDDTGDGKGINAGAKGEDGTVAGVTYLDSPVAPTSSDPEVQKLLTQQQALMEQVDDLRRRRASMSEQDFDREFEKLIIELSLVSREVRRRK